MTKESHAVYTHKSRNTFKDVYRYWYKTVGCKENPLRRTIKSGLGKRERCMKKNISFLSYFCTFNCYLMKAYYFYKIIVSEDYLGMLIHA